MTVCTSERAIVFLWEVSRRELLVQNEKNQSFESDTRHILYRILRHALLWERNHNQGKSGIFAQKTFHDEVLPEFVALERAQEVLFE